jgi:hypothetical protein
MAMDGVQKCLASLQGGIEIWHGLDRSRTLSRINHRGMSRKLKSTVGAQIGQTRFVRIPQAIS